MHHPVLSDPERSTRRARLERRQVIDEYIAAYVATVERNAFVETAQRVGVPVIPVIGPDEFVEHPHTMARGFFRTVEQPGFGNTEPLRDYYSYGQQVMVMQCDRDPDPQVLGLSTDKWDGAVAARDRLVAAVGDARLANLVVLTGDVHNYWAGELKKHFNDPNSATLGIEFVATSIASGGDNFETNDRFKTLLTQNPHIKFYNNQRGYVRHVVTPNHWQAAFQVLEKVSLRDGHISTRKSCVVEHGKNSLVDA